MCSNSSAFQKYESDFVAKGESIRFQTPLMFYKFMYERHVESHVSVNESDGRSVMVKRYLQSCALGRAYWEGIML